MLIGSNALDDQVVVAIEHLSENKEEKEIDRWLLRVLEKANYDIRALRS